MDSIEARFKPWMGRNVRLALHVALHALLLMPLRSLATTVIDESQIGDFHGGQLFPLTEGQNIFIGKHQWQGTDPFDAFRFVVAPGRQATINFSYTFDSLTSGEKQAWIWDLSTLPNGTGSCTPSGFIYSCLSVPGQSHLLSEIFQSESGYVNPPPNLTFGIFSQLTLVSGTYLLGDNFGFDNLGTNSSATGIFSYSIEIDETAVPLPSTWILALCGFPILYFYRRA